MNLLMFSGGLDSTGALFKMLTETTEPLHVHHVMIKNLEQRWEAEWRAVQDILQYCKNNYRDFKFTTNVFEFSQFSSFFAWDNDVVRFIAAQICRDNPKIRRLVLGKCKEDDDPMFRLRSIQAYAIWKSCFFDFHGNPPQIVRPVGDMTKGEIANMLPPDLLMLTWSCRRPIRDTKNDLFHPCQNCKTCKQMQKHALV